MSRTRGWSPRAAERLVEALVACQTNRGSRRAVRYALNVPVTIQGSAGWAMDVSCLGIGFLAQVRYEVDQVIEVDFPEAVGRDLALSVQIVYARPAFAHTWRLGCAFLFDDGL